MTRGEQRSRFIVRRIDPVRQWKPSPTDLASLDKWDAYTEAKEAMFASTDTEHAPWTVIKSNDKKRARLAALRHVLGRFDYDNKDPEAVGRPDPLIVLPAAARRPGWARGARRRCSSSPATSCRPGWRESARCGI